jgi:proline iminopeptidase
MIMRLPAVFMIRSTIWLTSLVFLELAPAQQQTPPADDVYSPGRALVADINRIVTPNGIDETFEVVLGGARQMLSVRGADASATCPSCGALREKPDE